MNPDDLLPSISRPGRYLGSEFNLPDIDLNAELKWALIFPDLYEIGMSHQGLHILYHLINQEQGFSAERCYCPAPDAEALMREHGVPLTTLESRRPLSDYDLIGITLPHELCYTNILTIFDLAAIEFLAEARSEASPIIIGGGTCGFNPEPVAELFDAVLIGDGEEAVVEISRLVASCKTEGSDRARIINDLAAVDGVYLPRRYNPRFRRDGTIASIGSAPASPPMIKRRVLPTLDQIDHLLKPLVPNARIIHDRLAVEVARGCTRGCRFCQAGITYRPVRERSTTQIMELAERGIAHSGFDEISLLSLSTGDYSCLPEVLPRLMQRFADEKVSVALPSMRVGTLTRELMDQIRTVRKTGFTLAPEAGSERLRQTINKGISEKDLLQTAEQAYALGWNLIKLYFMIGLPTETDKDLDAIVDLVEKTARAGAVSGRSRKKISVSVGTFVPKPHTPFQWEAQLSIEESRRRLNYLKSRLQKKAITLKYHDPEQSFLEGVFSRGDRRLTPLLIAAWEKGARLDSWSDYFDLSRWLDAAADIGLELDGYLAGRNVDELLPWSHIDSMVDLQFLVEERDKGLHQSYTADCRYHGCQKCGLCDFKTVMPIVHNPERAVSAPPPEAEKPSLPEPAEIAGPAEHHRYLVSYSRTGMICYLGHLEFLQIIQRGLRRAQLKTHFSHGFNPLPKISFGPALPVGTQSLAEFFAVDLMSPLENPAATAELLDHALPAGLAVKEIRPLSGTLVQNMASSYEIKLPFRIDAAGTEQIDHFRASASFSIKLVRKGRRKMLDIRPLVTTIDAVSEEKIELTLISRSGAAGAKPSEVVAAVLQLDDQTVLKLRVLKTSWVEIDR
jgi:radical SAM family uncharacterized protein/radical SAM-linked protein